MLLLNLNIFENYTESISNLTIRNNILKNVDKTYFDEKEKNIKCKRTCTPDLSEVEATIYYFRNMFKSSYLFSKILVFIVCIELHGDGDRYVVNGIKSGKRTYIECLLSLIRKYFFCTRIIVLDSSCSNNDVVNNEILSLKISSRLKLIINNSCSYYTDSIVDFEVRDMNTNVAKIGDGCICHAMYIYVDNGNPGKWFRNKTATIYDKPFVISTNDVCLYYLLSYESLLSDCRTIQHIIKLVNADFNLELKAEPIEQCCSELNLMSRIRICKDYYSYRSTISLKVEYRRPYYIGEDHVLMTHNKPLEEVITIDNNCEHYKILWGDTTRVNGYRVFFSDNHTRVVHVHISCRATIYVCESGRILSKTDIPYSCERTFNFNQTFPCVDIVLGEYDDTIDLVKANVERYRYQPTVVSMRSSCPALVVISVIGHPNRIQKELVYESRDINYSELLNGLNMHDIDLSINLKVAYTLNKFLKKLERNDMRINCVSDIGYYLFESNEVIGVPIRHEYKFFAATQNCVYYYDGTGMIRVKSSYDLFTGLDQDIHEDTFVTFINAINLDDIIEFEDN